MQPFDYIRPQSLEETIRLLAQTERQTRVLAGGVDLLPKMELGQLGADQVLDIKHLAETSRIELEPGRGLRCGAAISLARLADHTDVRRHFPLLAQACERVASPQVRNRATIGGAICIAVANSSLAPVLLCYDAICNLFGQTGNRALPLSEFFTGSGLTALTPGELLVDIILPLPDRTTRAAYHQVRNVMGGHGPLAGVAAAANRPEEDVVWRLAVTGAAPYPFRATEAEDLLTGQPLTPANIAAAVESMTSSCQPLDDPSATAAYRRALVAILARRCIDEIVGQMAGGPP